MIVLATNVVMSIIAITLQIITKDVFHRVIKERKIIAKNGKTTFNVIYQQHLDIDSMIYLTYIECIRKVGMLDVSYGPWYIKPRSKKI